MNPAQPSTAGAAPVIPPAFHQAAQPVEALLNSASCGLIIQRTGQIKGKYRSEGRQFARELAEHINERQLGRATVFVYEETFGVKERLHWLIHLRSLRDYPTMVAMGAADEKFRELILRERLPGGGRWDEIFLDGSLRETVLVPQRWLSPGRDGAPSGTALDQLGPGETTFLHSATASSIVQVSGILRHEHRRSGREVGRRLAERLNREQAGAITALVYDEAFGAGERVHWLLHLSALSDHAELAPYLGPEPVAEGSGAGPAAEPSWRELFVEGSLSEVALTPQFWGLYATKKPS
ncbi:MAG TPA: DUF6039 family protein [Thermoanaerobaculia bacterium]|nr:DUF6039 family protein [Thermoanaerobaculia bacterium]